VCPSCGSLVGVRDDKCYTCGRANPGLWGFAPVLRELGADLGVAEIVVGGSAILYALTLLVSGRNIDPYPGGLAFLVPSPQVLRLFGMSGAIPVFLDGWWWTLLSASWLHGNLLHIIFNMMWVRQLGPATADIVGPSRTIIIYTIAGVCGFLLSSIAGLLLGGLSIPILRPGFNTLGASAAVFGLLGALVHYGRKSGSSLIRNEAKSYAITMFIFGLIMPGIDNYAHAGGFLGGYAASAMMNPLTRERGDHLLMAVGCLAATVLAIAFSVLRGLGLI
jgi:membrane associated rhomboid family serine protease